MPKNIKVKREGIKETVDIEAVVTRAREAAKVEKNKQLAELIGMSEHSFSNMKISGSIINHLLVWAIKEQINLSWLFYGSDTPKQDQLLEEIQQLQKWLSEISLNDPNRIAWFKVELLDKFPAFKEWLNTETNK
ncbi:hypothetical protein GMJAKD_02595 [Candidatus Electrothrix aarhusensis]